MGLFDTVLAPCASCGEQLAFQTKSGSCDLASYKLKDAPADVLRDVNRHAPLKCTCGAFNVVLVSGLKGAFVVQVHWSKEKADQQDEKFANQLLAAVKEEQ